MSCTPTILLFVISVLLMCRLAGAVDYGGIDGASANDEEWSAPNETAEAYCTFHLTGDTGLWMASQFPCK